MSSRPGGPQFERPEFQDMATKLRPLHDRIIVQRIEEGEQKVGGIIIPTAPRKSPSRARSSPSAPASRQGRQEDPARRQGGRHDSLRQVLGSGNQDRWRRVPHHARGRSPRRGREVTQERTETRAHGKADYLRRAVAAGNPARREPAGRRSQGHARSQGPQRRPRQEVRLPHHHQGRRDGRQGNRPEGPAREHGRPDGPRSREQDLGHRR